MYIILYNIYKKKKLQYSYGLTINVNKSPFIVQKYAHLNTLSDSMACVLSGKYWFKVRIVSLTVTMLTETSKHPAKYTHIWIII